LGIYVSIPTKRLRRSLEMNYRKFDKAMHKSGVEYDIEETDAAVQIKTDPGNNDLAQKNIEPALGKSETCINSSPGKFSVIQTDVRVYKIPIEQKEDLES
jgi:hypothetical protein